MVGVSRQTVSDWFAGWSVKTAERRRRNPLPQCAGANPVFAGIKSDLLSWENSTAQTQISCFFPICTLSIS